MVSRLIFALRFYFLQAYKLRPLATVSSASMLIIAMALSVSLTYLQRTVAAANSEMAALRIQENAKVRNREGESVNAVSRPVLPWFQSSDLPSRMAQIAAEASLPLDEVDYSLEAGGNQPYMRYRIKMTVVATYPVIRRFVIDATSALSNVDLDAITCRRNDISTGVLSCDLALSAFFRKDANG